MPITSLGSAKTVFDEAFVSLMAHTIRGVINQFRKAGIELDVRVMPDTIGMLKLKAPKQGATSFLLSRLVKGAKVPERDRLYASIYIHQEANKHLARICIAHEIYHLLLELDEFLLKGRIQWPKVPVSRTMEDSCNHFAWELCRLHDIFNRDTNLREKHVHFPDGTFIQPFPVDDATNWVNKWPNGIALDPRNPFYKPF